MSILDVPEKLLIANEEKLGDLEALVAEQGGPVGLSVQVEIVSYWHRTDVDAPEKGLGRLVMKGPDGKAVGEPQEFSVDLQQANGFRQQFGLSAMPFVGLGFYWFVIHL